MCLKLNPCCPILNAGSLIVFIFSKYPVESVVLSSDCSVLSDIYWSHWLSRNNLTRSTTVYRDKQNWNECCMVTKRDYWPRKSSPHGYKEKLLDLLDVSAYITSAILLFACLLYPRFIFSVKISNTPNQARHSHDKHDKRY